MSWFMKLYRFFEKWVAMNAPEIAYSNFSSLPKFPSKVWLPAFHYTNGESVLLGDSTYLAWICPSYSGWGRIDGVVG